MSGANNKPFGEDVKNSLVPPMAAFADIDSKGAIPLPSENSVTKFENFWKKSGEIDEK